MVSFVYLRSNWLAYEIIGLFKSKWVTFCYVCFITIFVNQNDYNFSPYQEITRVFILDCLALL